MVLVTEKLGATRLALLRVFSNIDCSYRGGRDRLPCSHPLRPLADATPGLAGVGWLTPNNCVTLAGTERRASRLPPSAASSCHLPRQPPRHASSGGRRACPVTSTSPSSSYFSHQLGPTSKKPLAYMWYNTKEVIYPTCSLQLLL